MLWYRFRVSFDSQFERTFGRRTAAAVHQTVDPAYVESLESRVLLTNGLHGLAGALFHVVDHATLEEGDAREGEVEQEHANLIDDATDRLGGGDDVEEVVRSVIETLETVVAYVDQRLDGRLREFADHVLETHGGTENAAIENEGLATFATTAEELTTSQAALPAASGLFESAAHVFEHAALEENDPNVLQIEQAHDDLAERLSSKFGGDEKIEQVVRSLFHTAEDVVEYAHDKLEVALDQIAERLDGGWWQHDDCEDTPTDNTLHEVDDFFGSLSSPGADNPLVETTV